MSFKFRPQGTQISVIAQFGQKVGRVVLASRGVLWATDLVSSKRTTARVSCILLLISLTIPGRAAVIEKTGGDWIAASGPGHSGHATHYAEADVNLLRRAYHLLERADHDYKGNRKAGR